MSTIAFFGGSFDPPHIGHQMIVERVLSEYPIDTLYVVPAYLNPQKTHFCAEPALRYRWLTQIFAHEPHVVVSDMELICKKPSFTYDTITTFLAQNGGKQSYDKIYLIIGYDNAATFHTWYRYAELLSLVTPIVVKRAGFDVHLSCDEISLECPFSSSEFRRTLDERMLPESVRDEIITFYKGVC